MQKVYTPPQPGTKIRGRYVVEDILGNQRFGSVYLVSDQRNNHKHFVLKEVPDPGWKDRFHIPFGSKRFKRLEHPALPHVYQVFNDRRHGQAYMLVDYIEGPNLVIQQQGQREQRFSFSQVVSLIAPIMNAVTHLHSQHHPIIHGDIKPSNIIVRKEDALPVLVGFSLVKGSGTEIPLSSEGHGTPGFKAPEQYGREIYPQTDIYALGAVLYTLLSGTVPVDARIRLMQLDKKEPDPLLPVNQMVPHVPSTVASAIHRAMSIHRNDRYITVDQFWNALWQEPIYTPMVQHTRRQLIAPPAEGNGELDANLTKEDTTKDSDATVRVTRLRGVPERGNGELDANLTKEDTTKDSDATVRGDPSSWSAKSGN